MGPPSDVYSLGAILHHLLTGRAPFAAESVTDTLQQVLHNEPVSPRLLNPAVPVDLETICLKCLQKESARRYTTATELAEELRRFLRGEPILARPLASPTRRGGAGANPRWPRSAGIAWCIPRRGNRSRLQRFERPRAIRRRAEFVCRRHETASEAMRYGAIDRARELLNRHRPKPGPLTCAASVALSLAEPQIARSRELWRACRGTWVLRDARARGDTLYNLVTAGMNCGHGT